MRCVSLTLRYVWASPASTIGLVLAAIALPFGARMRLIGGVIEVGGGSIRRGIDLLPSSLRFAAITFGHVIIGIDHAVLRRVRAHELVHVRQYERWGILFFPAYLGSSLFQLVRGRDPYRDNFFEREAYASHADARVEES